MMKSSAADYEQIKSRLAGSVNTMKARLRRALMAAERRDWDFGREQGKLDSKRLVAGYIGAPNVYKVRKDRNEFDTAVHFLVDLSGSMGGDKIQVACESMVALAECLEGTGIKYQISGFENPHQFSGFDFKNGGSYERIEALACYKYKRWEQPLTSAKGTIAAIRNSAGYNNSDRDAILWAYSELKTRPEKRKILFVLSDGQPYNYKHRSTTSLEKALKSAVEDVRKAGVECVGIGIKDDTVLKIYGRAVSIKSVDELSGAAFNQLSNILTGGKVVF
jgi:cobaltochelatase CobT